MLLTPFFCLFCFCARPALYLSSALGLGLWAEHWYAVTCHDDITVYLETAKWFLDDDLSGMGWIGMESTRAEPATTRP